MFIATLAEIKTELGIEDPQEDTLLTAFLEALEARFEAHLNRNLCRVASGTEYFDGDVLWLKVKRYPIESVANIWIDADQEWEDADALETDDYRLDWARGRIAYGTGSERWPAGFQNIKVQFTGGYVAAGTTAGSGQTAMPEAIRACYRLQAGYEWRNRLHLGQQSVNAQGYSVNLAPAKLLPEVEAGLVPYRNLA